MKGAGSRWALLLAMCWLGSSWSALAHEPGEDNELPDGGTLHELRITSLVSESVAQQIFQPSICDNPGVCLYDEIHLPVVINFDEGTIAIDAREPQDAHGDEVTTGILFNTLSGPAELVLAPPCENPDGCIGGTPIYLGTIDTDGNIRFPSIGLEFELFGFEPITDFDSPMGTGTFVDAGDPTEVVEGSPLNFATGEVTLAGIEFTPAPIIGNSLIAPVIRGTILPIPVPPASPTSLLRCQTAIERRGAGFVQSAQKDLQACVEGLLACQLGAEAGGAVDPTCADDATAACAAAIARIAEDRATFSVSVAASCADGLAAANLLSATRGLGFGTSDAECRSLGIEDLGSLEAIIECLARSLQCSVEDMATLVEPRAGELLSADFSSVVQPAGCALLFPPGDASGSEAAALLACEATLGQQTARYVHSKQLLLQRCMSGFLDCEFEDLAEDDLAACRQRAAQRCDSLASRIERLAARKDLRIRRSCESIDAAGLAQGLGFASLSEHCESFEPPLDPTNLDEIVECVGASVDCSVEGVVRLLEPRASLSLEEDSVGQSLIQRFPCLAPTCGNGFVDRGEECDPFLDTSCRDGCVLAVCGDEILDPDLGEECDDGNTDPFDGCSELCEIELFQCGNGVLETFAMEICDDFNTAGGDGCSSDCHSDESCGNGVLDSMVGEQCDDANLLDGDGCSADCRSDETCGNGVVDLVLAEECDDGNAETGDGCDAACNFEACAFFDTGVPLGTRELSVDPAASGHDVSIPARIGTIGFTSGSFVLEAGAPDQNGNAAVTLANDVIVGVQISQGNFTQCFKFVAVETAGALHCCGGAASGMSFTRDSNTGGIGGNGPAVVLSGVGSGTRGDLEMAFQVSLSSAPLDAPQDCATASYGAPHLEPWTSGPALGRVIRPAQPGEVHEFSLTGQPFDCSTWTTENSVGGFASADTALNAIPELLDLVNVRILDDHAED